MVIAMAETADVTFEGFTISFRHGWDAALDEAILIAETAEFNKESVTELVRALKQFRDANR